MARLEEFGTLAIVTWHDTHSDHPGWVSIGDLQQVPCIVHSVGWLIPTQDGGNPDHVTLYQSRIEGTNEVDSICHIPVKMVIGMKLITRPDFR